MIQGGEEVSRKKTQEEYVAEVTRINPNIDVIESYINAKTAILHKCKIDGYQWSAYPSNILKGHGCPMCCGNIKKTHEQYIQEVKNINANIEVVDLYVNAKTPIRHQCKIDNHIWKVAPYVILRGDGCPKCAGNAKKTTQEYITELLNINPNVEVLGEYINATTPIAHKCKIDQNIWYVAPSNILKGTGCPLCKNILLSSMFKKSHQQYIYELSIINPDVEVIEEYNGASTPIFHRCKLDNYIWKVTPNNMLIGRGCPRCQESSGERQIRQWLETHNLEYEYQHSFIGCKDKYLLPFDFYIPSLNICVEYDGVQHFQPIDFAGKGDKWAENNFQLTQYHDKIKNKYCKSNKIRLLRIPYFKNIEEELQKFLFI